MARVSEDRLAAWQSFLRAHAVVTAALGDELEEQRQLSLPWYEVLLQLHAAGGRLQMKELARAVLFSRSGLTRLVDRMVDAGLVRREQCPSDRRGMFAVLTPEGRRRLRGAAGVHLRGIEEHFARHLTDHDVRALGKALDEVLAAEGSE